MLPKSLVMYNKQYSPRALMFRSEKGIASFPSGRRVFWTGSLPEMYLNVR